jgi:hypothetical protein
VRDKSGSFKEKNLYSHKGDACPHEILLNLNKKKKNFENVKKLSQKEERRT